MDLASDGALYLALNTLAGSGGGIFKSEDGGTSWTQVYEGGDVLSIAVDPLDAQTVYAGTTDDYSWSTEGGALKSADGGQTWTVIFDQPRVGWVLPHPTESGLVLAALQPWWNYARGVWLSRDGGLTWADASEGLGHRFTLAARFNPHNPTQVLVATHGGGVWLGEIELATTIPGDFDSDGDVDFSDFFLFADNFGSDNAAFELDASGTVDFGDFFIMADNFGL